MYSRKTSAVGLPRSWSPRSNETVSRVSCVGESRAICKGHGTPTKLESSIERDCFKGIRCRGVPSHLQRPWDSHGAGVLDRTRLFQGYQRVRALLALCERGGSPIAHSLCKVVDATTLNCLHPNVVDPFMSAHQSARKWMSRFGLLWLLHPLRDPLEMC